MKTTFALSAFLALSVAGCASTEPQQYAKADCKVAPVTPRSVVNKAGPVTELDRRYAEAQLRGSDYRRQQFDRLGTEGAVEQALRDCP